jgi:hypothetical protein
MNFLRHLDQLKIPKINQKYQQIYKNNQDLDKLERKEKSK